jgi:drug/metabolite transporter (DMT)-like permease
MQQQKKWAAFVWMAFGAICLTLADFAMKQVAVMGGLAVLGLASVSRALQLAAVNGKAGTVGLMFYVQMPVALVIGYLVYAEQPSLMALLGAGLIVAAGMSLPLRAGVSSLRQK